MSQIAAHCNKCAGNRTHNQLHAERTSWSIESFDLSGIDTYEMLKCLGCGEIKIRHIALCSDENRQTTTYFPPAIFRPEPNWFENLREKLPLQDEFVYFLLKEIYAALQNNLSRLAAMGVRALIERVMISKISEQGTFTKNLSKFEEAGFISRIQRDRIESVLEVGHATIHRAYSPNEKDIKTLLDITEHLVEAVYLHEDQILAVSRRIPRRTKTRKPE